MTTYYSPPRKCPVCGFVTADRAFYWEHRLTHEEHPVDSALTITHGVAGQTRTTALFSRSGSDR